MAQLYHAVCKLEPEEFARNAFSSLMVLRQLHIIRSQGLAELL